MPSTYDKELKQKKDGTYYRWIGSNEKGTNQQLLCGRDKPEAERRLNLILSLYEMQFEATRYIDGSWVPEQLAAAKLIAKGKPAKLPRLALPVNDKDVIQESEISFAKRLAILNLNGDAFQPKNADDLSQAIQSIEAQQRKYRILRAKLTGTNGDHETP